MINALKNYKPTPSGRPPKRRPKGWSPARRARQAALIRGWQPWRRSTGPRSEAGKARSAMNPLKHGRRSRANVLRLRRIRHALRLAARNLAMIRAHVLRRMLAAAQAAQVAALQRLARDIPLEAAKASADVLAKEGHNPENRFLADQEVNLLPRSLAAEAHRRTRISLME